MISNINNQKMELEEFNIDEDGKQVLLGSLLGDGSLQIQKGGKNAFYREIHSLKQKDYLIWKNQFLKVFDTKLHEYSIYDSRTNKTYYSVLLWSKTSQILTYYYNILYKERRKTISQELLNEINIFGLAIWYMDDGCYHYGDGRCQLGTDALSYQEHLLIKDWLRRIFGINIQIHKRIKSNKESYTTVLTKIETDKFLNLIEPFIIPNMYYKLGHLKEENSSKIGIHNNKVIQYRKLEYQFNKEKYLRHNREYRKANKERLIKQRKEYYLLNKEKILKHKQVYYIKNKTIIQEKQKIRRQNGIDAYKKRDHEYYIKNRQKILEREKAYQKKNRDKINKRKRERSLKDLEYRERRNRQQREYYYKRKLSKVNQNGVIP